MNNDYLDDLIYDCKYVTKEELPPLIKRVVSLSDLDEDYIISYLKIDEADYENYMYFGTPIAAIEAVRIKRRLLAMLKKSQNED